MKPHEERHYLHWKENNPFDNTELKKCPKCNEYKKRTEFNRLNKSSDGLNNYCKQCSLFSIKQTRIKDPKRTWKVNTLQRSKANARRKGGYHSITLDDIQTPDRCMIPSCNKLLNYLNSRTDSRNSSPSLDKIFPEKWYIKGNILTICNECNNSKCNNSPVDFLQWIKDYRMLGYL